MQEYKKISETEQDTKRYFELDENDCLIIPSKEVAPELYILGGFFNTSKAEFEKVTQQLILNSAENKIDDKSKEQEKQGLTQKENVAIPTIVVEEQQQSNDPTESLEMFANSFKKKEEQKKYEYDDYDEQPQPSIENIYNNNKTEEPMRSDQDYINSLNEEIHPENIFIDPNIDDDIEFYAQIDNTDYTKDDIAEYEDVLTEEEINNSFGYDMTESKDNGSNDDEFYEL